MIVELSMKLTFATSNMNLSEECDVYCINKYSVVGFELFIAEYWKEVLLDRPGFFDIVIVSRPRTMKVVNKVLLDAYKSNKFAII